MVPEPTKVLPSDHLALQGALVSETSYMIVLVVHKKHVQELFDYIRNGKTC